MRDPNARRLRALVARARVRRALGLWWRFLDPFLWAALAVLAAALPVHFSWWALPPPLVLAILLVPLAGPWFRVWRALPPAARCACGLDGELGAGGLLLAAWELSRPGRCDTPLAGLIRRRAGARLETWRRRRPRGGGGPRTRQVGGLLVLAALGLVAMLPGRAPGPEAADREPLAGAETPGPVMGVLQDLIRRHPPSLGRGPGEEREPGGGPLRGRAGATERPARGHSAAKGRHQGGARASGKGQGDRPGGTRAGSGGPAPAAAAVPVEYRDLSRAGTAGSGAGPGQGYGPGVPLAPGQRGGGPVPAARVPVQADAGGSPDPALRAYMSRYASLAEDPS